MDHGLGTIWQVEELTSDYEDGGTLSVYIATDVQQSDMATDPTATATSNGDEILLGRTFIPTGYDAVQIVLEGGDSLAGTISGFQSTNTIISTSINCFSSPNGECVLIKDHSGEDFYITGYGPYLSALEFVQPGQQPTRETVQPRRYGSVTAADYLAFGNWLYVPGDTTKNLDYDFGVFASGGEPFQVGHIEGLVGTATYEGDATGIYYVDRLATNPNIGSFIADVMLTADFGTSSEYGTVNGEVSNFVFDGDVSSSFPTEVDLTRNVNAFFAQVPELQQNQRNIIGIVGYPYNISPAYTSGQPGGWINGLTAASVDGETWQGRWDGKFYGNGVSPTDLPTSIAGVFGSSNSSNGLIGSFGAAYRQ